MHADFQVGSFETKEKASYHQSFRVLIVMTLSLEENNDNEPNDQSSFKWIFSDGFNLSKIKAPSEPWTVVILQDTATSQDSSIK